MLLCPGPLGTRSSSLLLMRDPGPCWLPGTGNTLKSQAGGIHASLQGFRAQLAREQGAEWKSRRKTRLGWHEREDGGGDGQNENTPKQQPRRLQDRWGEEQPLFRRASWLWSRPLRSSPALSSFNLVDFHQWGCPSRISSCHLHYKAFFSPSDGINHSRHPLSSKCTLRFRTLCPSSWFQICPLHKAVRAPRHTHSATSISPTMPNTGLRMH